MGVFRRRERVWHSVQLCRGSAHPIEAISDLSQISSPSPDTPLDRTLFCPLPHSAPLAPTQGYRITEWMTPTSGAMTPRPSKTPNGTRSRTISPTYVRPNPVIPVPHPHPHTPYPRASHTRPPPQAGYREGITAGKEGALQEGFDDGFASVGAPLGRDLGLLRGLAAALLAFLSRPPIAVERGTLAGEVRDIANALSNVRLSDIAPPDLEALAHAREHLEQARMDADDDDDLVADPAAPNEDLKAKRDMESLEDPMAQMSSGSSGSASGVKANLKRPTAEDVVQLKERLLAIARELGLELEVQWS